MRLYNAATASQDPGSPPRVGPDSLFRSDRRCCATASPRGCRGTAPLAVGAWCVTASRVILLTHAMVAIARAAR